MGGTAVNGIEIMQGDCLDVMRTLPDGSVDLVMTSPPYAEKRKRQYGGVRPDEYPAWFCERAGEMRRVLNAAGSVIVNISEYVQDGQMSTYASETRLEMIRRGWRNPQWSIWYKTNGMQGKWPDRLRHAWENCFQFTVSKRYKMNKDAVKVPPKPSTIRRYNSRSAADARRRASGTGSGMTIQSFAGPPPKWVYPDNVIMMGNATRNTGHPAAYPVSLAEHFIKMHTDPGDMVLDPFVGGGSTLVAAAKLGRRAIGIDILQKYCDGSRARLEEYAGQAGGA